MFLIGLVIFSSCFAISNAQEKLLARHEIVKIAGNILIPKDRTITSAIVIFGSATIEGAVKKDVVVIAGVADIRPTAHIGRDVVTIGGKIHKAEEAKIYGNTREIIFPYLDLKLDLPGLVFGMGVLRLMIFVGFLALACLITSLFPGRIHILSEVVERRPVKMFLWGLLGLVLIPFATLILVVSIVGIALIPLEVIIIVLALLLGYIALSQIIGKIVLKGLGMFDKPIGIEVITGIIVVDLIGLIPLIGWILKPIIATIGLGSILFTRFATKRVLS